MDDFRGDRVLTGDGTYTIRHPLYQEEFHSREGARYESHELYMNASGYTARLAAGESPLGVLDVGLGLGYNALMTLEFWMQSPGLCPVNMVSLEQTEALIEAMVSPDTAWKDGWNADWLEWSAALKRSENGIWSAAFRHPVSGQIFQWTAHVGDARAVPLVEGSLDFVWQDAFSPKKNPELWTVEWFEKLLKASRPGACLVTYSVARLVKDNLSASGWGYERVQATTNKRQWLRARPQT